MPVAPFRGALSPLSLQSVQLDADGYWGRWQAVNATAIIDHCHYWMERVGWIENFRSAAAGTLPAARQGREFTDADVYKLLEAMCWEFGRTGEHELNKTIESLTSIIAAAQETDGYINTKFGRPGQGERYSDFQWGHELYNYGHLIQAAVGRIRTVGRDDPLVDIAIKAANHVCEAFGVSGRQSVCGHPGIEVALVEFARATGDIKYSEQAKLFIDRRGHGSLGEIEFGREYFQDDVPIRDADVFRGHAVRALYLAAGAVDLAVDTSDASLLDAIEAQWTRTVSRRTYITGGMGSHHQDEAFGEDFELPSDRAYCETCAGVASVMLSWRLLLATGDPKYADLMERTLHNVVATSPATDGKSFFYANTLHQRIPGTTPDPDEQSPRASSSQRSAWFEVSCCPTNIARTFATIGGYVATSDAEGVQLHLYTSGRIHTTIPAGLVDLQVTTGYPHDGDVTVEILAAPATWNLTLRIPSWAASATVEVGGVQFPVPRTGAFTVPVALSVGDELLLHLPMQPRFSWPDQRIDAVRGTVAVERGPIVYCLESASIGGAPVDPVTIDEKAGPELRDGRVFVTGHRPQLGEEPWPFLGSHPHPTGEDAEDLELTPYSDWGERAPGTMRIWLPLISAN